MLTRDALLDVLLRARVGPGGSVSVIAGVAGPDGTRAVGACGEGEDGRPPVGVESVFEIGSAEKVFTGTLFWHSWSSAARSR